MEKLAENDVTNEPSTETDFPGAISDILFCISCRLGFTNQSLVIKHIESHHKIKDQPDLIAMMVKKAKTTCCISFTDS